MTYTNDDLISLLLNAKEAFELGIAEQTRDFDHVVLHRINTVIRSLKEQAAWNVIAEPASIRDA